MSSTLPFLNKGMTRAAFHSEGTTPDRKEVEMIAVRGLATMSAESTKSRQGQLLYQVLIHAVEISRKPQTLQQT